MSDVLELEQQYFNLASQYAEVSMDLRRLEAIEKEVGSAFRVAKENVLAARAKAKAEAEAEAKAAEKPVVVEPVAEPAA